MGSQKRGGRAHDIFYNERGCAHILLFGSSLHPHIPELLSLVIILRCPCKHRSYHRRYIFFVLWLTTI
jgi:hypothetical protein